MQLIEKASSFILSSLLKNEEFQKFPQDFITESVKWVRSWFLVDDPRTEEKLNSDKSADYKKAVVETKLESLMENPQFKQELEALFAAYERHAAAIPIPSMSQKKNTVEGSNLSAGGNIRVGDEQYQAGGNIQIVHNYSSTPPQASHPPEKPLTKPAVSPDMKEGLRKSVAASRIKEAIEQLSALSIGHPEFRNMVLQQSGKWEALKRQEMMGTLSYSEAGTERARIAAAVLELIGELG